MVMKQYDICLVNLDPTLGHEIQKTRPCVIISPDEMNTWLETLIIAPMTTKSHPYPTRVSIQFQNKEGWIVLDQIRTVDKRRVVKILGKLDSRKTQVVKETLDEMLVK
ncbi:MAG: type II toxin-antitoxin system PemK/MazF family toxin [Prevotellaceae bacterium]|jgi:mRNA interferase MazF|nr:type II toxin-antitoxin system PemK/MazF family toxin [Prevotellaceae bacterium]